MIEQQQQKIRLSFEGGTPTPDTSENTNSRVDNVLSRLRQVNTNLRNNKGLHSKTGNIIIAAAILHYMLCGLVCEVDVTTRMTITM